MKRNLLLFVLLLGCLAVQAQELYKQVLPLSKETGKVEFQQVLEAPGKSKEEVYTLTRQWFVQTFVSANAVLQMEDKEAGLLIGKGRIGDADFLVKVETKEGKARYTLTDIVYSYPALNKTYPAEEMLSDKNLYKANGSPRQIQRALKEQLLQTNGDFIASLQQALTKGGTASDW